MLLVNVLDTGETTDDGITICVCENGPGCVGKVADIHGGGIGVDNHVGIELGRRRLDGSLLSATPCRCYHRTSRQPAAQSPITEEPKPRPNEARYRLDFTKRMAKGV